MTPQTSRDVYSASTAPPFHTSSGWSLPAPSNIPERQYAPFGGGYIELSPSLALLTSAGSEGGEFYGSHFTQSVYHDGPTLSTSVSLSPRFDAELPRMHHTSFDKALYQRRDSSSILPPSLGSSTPLEPAIDTFLDQFINWPKSPEPLSTSVGCHDFECEDTTPHWRGVFRESSVESFDDQDGSNLEPVASEQDSRPTGENVPPSGEASSAAGSSQAVELPTKQLYTKVKDEKGKLQYKCLYVPNYGPKCERVPCTSMPTIRMTKKGKKGSKAGKRARATSEDGSTLHERNWIRHFWTTHAAKEYKRIQDGDLEPDDAFALQHPLACMQKAVCTEPHCWYATKFRKPWRIKCWGRTERKIKTHREKHHGRGGPPLDWVPPTIESEDEFAVLKEKHALAKKNGTLTKKGALAKKGALSKKGAKSRKPRTRAKAKAAAQPHASASTSSPGALPVSQPDTSSVPPPLPPRSGTRPGKRKRDLETVDPETAAAAPAAPDVTSRRKRTKYWR